MAKNRIFKMIMESFLRIVEKKIRPIFKYFIIPYEFLYLRQWKQLR